MQFCPDWCFHVNTLLDTEIAKGKNFVSPKRVFLAEAGWRTLLGGKERDERKRRYAAAGCRQKVTVCCVKRGSGRTPKPSRRVIFTDATLLSR